MTVINITYDKPMTEPTTPNPEKPLEDKWQTLAQARAAAEIELLKNYAAINEKSKNEKITAADFNSVEDRFNKKIETINNASQEILKNSGSDYETERKKSNDSYEESKKIIEDWKTHNPKIMQTIANVTNLDEAFRRDYLIKAPQKNLTLPEVTDTPEKLITELLKNNNGIAIGEWHTKDVASELISHNIKTLKTSGVDTIYLEMDDKSFSAINNLSITELKTRLNNRTSENIEKDSRNYAHIYSVKESDDILSANLRLFLAAKENGINIINIDKDGEARETERNLESHEWPIEQRFSSTNYTWTDKILQYRENKPKDSKYIVFGGFAHFVAFIDSKGLVDEALGIPVIAFDNREKDINKPILQGNSTNGADFYLPAGICHPDLHKLTDVANLVDTIKSIKAWAPVTAVEKFIESASKNIYELYKSTQLECSDVPSTSHKTPTYIPTTPPPQPASREHPPR